MLNIEKLVLGDYGTNCYLVSASGKNTCVVIDPGYAPETVAGRLEERALTPEAILLTHGHFDHVGGVKTLAGKYGCPVYLNEKELSLPPVMTGGDLVYSHGYSEGDTLPFDGFSVRVLETPGHTPGSVCLISGNVLFSGDTLFRGSCGRTDFPGGSREAMGASLRRLNGLNGGYTVYPGHGSDTTLAGEKKTNPYLKGML